MSRYYNGEIITEEGHITLFWNDEPDPEDPLNIIPYIEGMACALVHLYKMYEAREPVCNLKRWVRLIKERSQDQHKFMATRKKEYSEVRRKHNEEL